MAISAKKYVLILLVFEFFSSSAAPGIDYITRPFTSSFLGYVPNEIVVKLNQPDLSASAALGLLRNASLKNKKAFQTRIQKIGRMKRQFPHIKLNRNQTASVNLSKWFKITFTENMDVVAVAQEIKAINGVLDAQPIGIHAVAASIPQDTDFSLQKHLNQSNDADIDAPEAWDIERGNSDIIVAILDTGVRYFHKDLGGSSASLDSPQNARGNMWINTTELNGTASTDDDGNSFTDDWIGWDFVDGVTFGYRYYPISGEDYSTQDNDPRDFNGHGTHCAGIVSAMNNNGTGVSSPAGGWGDGTPQEQGNGVRIMPLRIGYSVIYAPPGGGSYEAGLIRTDFAAEALQYAADNGAKIASCSWGSSASGGLPDAIDYFLASGGLIFKAAGNDGADNPDYMGNRTDIINVAAVDEQDCKASFSNYGTWVDISAPGTWILSCYHDHNDPSTDKYAYASGTSMATPLAASIAALIWSHYPTWTAEQVKQKLYDSADNIDGLACNQPYAGELGAGRVNAFTALTVPLKTKIFLQGPYDHDTHQMATDLKAGGYIPELSPYSADQRGVTTVPPDVVDWVLVQLKKTPDGAVIASRSAFLFKDGRVVADDGATDYINIAAEAGDYYLLVSHRNHLTLMSSSVVSLSSGSSTLYDFTIGISQFYLSQGAVELETNVWGLPTGDINQDGFITTPDYQSWYNASRSVSNGYFDPDLNLNGQVTVDDYDLWLTNALNGLSTNVP
jgi:subtilisin family serine protease